MPVRLTALNAKQYQTRSNQVRLVTDRLVDWLDRNTHIPLSEEDMPLIQTLLTDTTNHIRHSRFGASSRGTCERAQVFGYLGFARRGSTIDYHLSNIFIDGQWRHIRWQLMMLKAGVIEEAEVPFSVPELRLGTSIDAVNYSEDFLVELKGDGSFKEVNEVREDHALQISTYFIASGLSKAVYIVEKKGTNSWTELVVTPDQVPMKEVEDELGRLNQAIDREQLPNALPDCQAKTGQIWRACPWRDNCGTATWDRASGQGVEIRSTATRSRIKKPNNRSNG